MDIKIPEIGENIKSGTVIRVAVSVGDRVSKDQDLVELETDKATVPIPSPADGVVKEILIKEGDTAKVGSVIMRIDAGAQAKESAAPKSDAPKQEAKKAESKPAAA